MKKIISLLLLLILSLTAVSCVSSEENLANDDEQNMAKELISDLIPKAEMLYGSVFNGGTHFEVDKSVTIPGFEEYALVVDDEIKSIDGLKAWVESIMTPEIAEVRFYKYIRGLDLPLSSYDKRYYRPLFYEYNGRLYTDTATGGHGYAFDFLFNTIQIISYTDTVITAEIDRTLFHSFDETSVIKLEKREGRWLIANDFIDNSDENIPLKVLQIVEMPQNAIEVKSDQSEPYKIFFKNNDEQYTAVLYFERINDHSDPDTVPEVRLFFSLSNDSADYFYYIGRYISGTPIMAPTYCYEVEQEAFTPCLMWYGGGGTAVFLAVENDAIYVYEVSADVPLEQAEPKVIADIRLKWL